MSTYSTKVWEELRGSMDERVFFGSRELLELVFIAYLVRGHVLLEGPPGTGKTLLAKLFAHAIGGSFKRIQFTSDLLPGDILGAHIYSPADSSFRFVPGPIFAEVIVADEMNRTPPRTQSALLEAMEERQVTIEGTTLPLSPTFFVVATQNPLEMEGTFPLPEAHVDRFLFKIQVSYADRGTDERMLAAILSGALPPDFSARRGGELELDRIESELAQVRIEPVLLRYISQILEATRTHPMLAHGSSIRGGSALMKAARVRALLQGRDFVMPDDIKFFCGVALAHRVRASAEAQISGVTEHSIIHEILQKIPLPTGGH